MSTGLIVKHFLSVLIRINVLSLLFAVNGLSTCGQKNEKKKKKIPSAILVGQSTSQPMTAL